LIDHLLGDPVAEDWRMYVPVLRAKASEWNALEFLTPGVRHRIAPVIEFIPDWHAPGASTSGRKRRAPQTPAEYVQRFLESSVKATPSGTRSFAYFGLAGSAGMWSGIDLWSEFECRTPAQARIVPLTDLRAVGTSPALVRAVRSRGEVGLRFGSPDVGPALATNLTSALMQLGVDAASVHLIVDLKDGPGAVSHAQVRTAVGMAGAFASVVALAGVFPQYLSQYQPGITLEPRTEWQVWWNDHVSTPADERLLAFGDYTTQHAHYHVTPEEARGTVSLRYTADDDFLVLRGRKSNSATGFGHNQMHGHCRLLIARPEYAGAAFSWADHRIHCWTNPSNGTGNFMQWRSASFVHHITLAVAQLQDPIGSSAAFRAWARSQAPAACP
jgi:hypothetical protein